NKASPVAASPPSRSSPRARSTPEGHGAPPPTGRAVVRNLVDPAHAVPRSPCCPRGLPLDRARPSCAGGLPDLCTADFEDFKRCRRERIDSSGRAEEYRSDRIATVRAALTDTAI